MSLTEAEEDEVRDGEGWLRGGEWGLGTGRVGDWCTLEGELEWEFLEGEPFSTAWGAGAGTELGTLRGEPVGELWTEVRGICPRETPV